MALGKNGFGKRGSFYLAAAMITTAALASGVTVIRSQGGQATPTSTMIQLTAIAPEGTATPVFTPISTATDQTPSVFMGVGVDDTPEGIRVAGVQGPASLAGLEPGDIILSVDGISVPTYASLLDVLMNYEPGDVIQVVFTRGRNLITTSLTLAARDGQFIPTLVPSPTLPLPTPVPTDSQTNPLPTFAPSVPPPPMEPTTVYQALYGFGTIGVDAQITPDNRLIITFVSPGGPAAYAGLIPGDVITDVDGLPTGGPLGNVMAVINQLYSNPTPRMTVLRNDNALFFDFMMIYGPTPVPTQMFPYTGPGRMGVFYEMLTPTLAQRRELPMQSGALILEVYPGSPASEAGLRPGDVIISVDGREVNLDLTLEYLVQPYRMGVEIPILVYRNGEYIEVMIIFTYRAYA
jgi:S1-C subfamily serine protease